jgi:hypothetical protein
MLVGIETSGVGRKNEDLHITQPKKCIYVLNIIIQNIMSKKDAKNRDPKVTPKTLMPPT